MGATCVEGFRCRGAARPPPSCAGWAPKERTGRLISDAQKAAGLISEVEIAIQTGLRRFDYSSGGAEEAYSELAGVGHPHHRLCHAGRPELDVAFGG